MEIILSSKALERIECEAVVLTFFQDERPLKGLSGLVDWRLHGFISRAIMDDIITGRFAEKTLIPSSNRLPAPKILCVGLGAGAQYSLSKLQEICTLILGTLYRIRVFTFVASLPGVETSGLDYSNAAECLVKGAISWAGGEGGGKAPFRCILLEKRDQFEKILSGLHRGRIKHKTSFELDLYRGKTG
jgi:hypothetical protein